MNVTAWKTFPKQCASSSNKDVDQTNHPAGDENIEACKSECIARPKCSAIEWYESAWEDSKCKLVLSDTPATQGNSNQRWKDAVCLVKPVEGRKLACQFVLLKSKSHYLPL